MVGAIWAGLLPTVIALAVYYCFADCVLLVQIFYYNHLMRQAASDAEHQFSPSPPLDPATPTSGPTQPLLSRRRSTSSQRSRPPSLRQKSPSPMMAAMKNMLVIAGTCLAGTIGWFVAWEAGIWKPEDSASEDLPQKAGAEFLGYLSALLYIGARIPQIIQNYRKKSCEGN